MPGRPVTNTTLKKPVLITLILNTELHIAKLILVIHLNKNLDISRVYSTLSVC